MFLTKEGAKFRSGALTSERGNNVSVGATLGRSIGKGHLFHDGPAAPAALLSVLEFTFFCQPTRASALYGAVLGYAKSHTPLGTLLVPS